MTSSFGLKIKFCQKLLAFRILLLIFIICNILIIIINYEGINIYNYEGGLVGVVVSGVQESDESGEPVGGSWNGSGRRFRRESGA